MEELLRWWPVIVTVGNLVVVWIAWSLRKMADGRIAEVGQALGKRIDRQHERILVLEEGIKHLPQREDIVRLNNAIGEVAGDMKAVRESLRRYDTMERQVTLIHDYLLNKKSL